MLRIQRKNATNFTFIGGKHIAPGESIIKDLKHIEDIKNSEYAKSMVEKGEWEIEDMDAEEKYPYAGKSVKDMKKIIAEIADKEIINLILESEGRNGVVDAAKKQLKLIEGESED